MGCHGPAISLSGRSQAPILPGIATPGPPVPQSPMTKIQAQIAPDVRPDVVFRQLADEWVLYDPRANQIHVLNLSAALVWTACKGSWGVDRIVEEVRGSYPDDPPERDVRRDVEAALERFAAEGLLR